jgi:hypothetical protein
VSGRVVTLTLGEWLRYERGVRLVIRLRGWRRTFWFGTRPPWEEWP